MITADTAVSWGFGFILWLSFCFVFENSGEIAQKPEKCITLPDILTVNCFCIPTACAFTPNPSVPPLARWVRWEPAAWIPGRREERAQGDAQARECPVAEHCASGSVCPGTGQDVELFLRVCMLTS